jgi:hypothetical protein
MNDRQVVDRSWDDLQVQMERHRRLVRCALEGRAADGRECLLGDCPHRRMLLDLVLDSVQVLDDTRKAFKSRQLEALRKKLLRVLAEASGIV